MSANKQQGKKLHTQTIKEELENSNRSGGDSSSSYTENSSSDQSKNVRVIRRKAGRISKQQLKRLKNREAAKKSRRLRKQHIQNLQIENIHLRDENDKLRAELSLLEKDDVSNKACSKCSTINVEQDLSMLKKPIAHDSEAEDIINEYKNNIDCNKKSDDDIRYERLAEDEDKQNGLQKLFLGLVFSFLIALAIFSDYKNEPSYIKDVSVSQSELPKMSQEQTMPLDSNALQHQIMQQ